jgi:enoyl ACP reductase
VLLDGKRLLITGVITKDSIAFHAASRAQEEGAEVLLTSFGRVRRLTERAAQRLPTTASCTRSRSRPRTRSAASS